MSVFLEGRFTYKPVSISEITQISPDTKLFRFALSSEAQQLGIRVGQHIAMRALIHSPKYPQGTVVRHKYSPTSRHDALGFFEIPIKVYYPQGEYPGGRLTTHLDALKLGDTVEISGPIGKYLYAGNGTIEFVRILCWRSVKQFDTIGFIEGGTGITPCFQYIQYIIERNEEIRVFLIFANRTPKDILMRRELDLFAQTGRLQLCYTVSTPEENWNYEVGHVNQEMILKYMPKPSETTQIFFCGPKGMNKMLRKLLPSLGFANFNKF